MALIGDKPRPRLLVVATENSGFEDYMPRLGALVPTIRFVTPLGLDSVRQAEWDAAILFDTLVALEDHLFVLQIGGQGSEQIEFPTVVARLVPDVSVASEFLLNEDAPQEIRPLVHSDLVPYVTANERNQVSRVRIEANRVTPHLTEVPVLTDIVEPFLSDGDGKPLAGRFKRTGGKAEWWMLPWTGGSVELWLSSALSVWSREYPDKIPASADWQTRPQWQVHDERLAQEGLQQLQDRRTRILEDLEREEANLRRSFEEARAAADSSQRLLLTAQGDDLAASVRAALAEIGFNVRDMDTDQAALGDRLEDLRVSDDDEIDWVALVEVRGYARGAQLNDLLRIGRFVTRYTSQEGRLPSAAWYVVNQFRATDPSTRPMPLHSNAQEVETFAEDGGAVFDTRTIFALLVSVQSGTIDRAEARRLLRSARGVFRLDEDEASGA